MSERETDEDPGESTRAMDITELATPPLGTPLHGQPFNGQARSGEPLRGQPRPLGPRVGLPPPPAPPAPPAPPPPPDPEMERLGEVLRRLHPTLEIPIVGGPLEQVIPPQPYARPLYDAPAPLRGGPPAAALQEPARSNQRTPSRSRSALRSLFSGRLEPGRLVRWGVVLLLVLAAVAGALSLRPGAGKNTPTGQSTDTAVTLTPLDATVTSFDPTPGGSGFVKSGRSWKTQNYGSAAFGQNKAGVGLLLDLGAKKSLADITVDVGDSALTARLYSGDSAPKVLADLDPVGKAVTSSGSLAFAPDAGGAHRYWLIWVTKLPARGGGYSAVLGTPVASAAG